MDDKEEGKTIRMQNKSWGEGAVLWIQIRKFMDSRVRNFLLSGKKVR
jgi:hypothetical protein